MIKDFFTVNRIGKNPNKTGSKIKWTNEQINYILSHYDQNHNVKELSILFDVSQATMRNLLHKNNVKTILTSEKAKNKRSRNSFYFHSIDTIDKSYWLGFLYADGYVNRKKNTLRINLKRDDKTHLEKFLKSISANGFSIKETIKHGKDKDYYGCYISITDKQIVSDLIKQGCVEKKSLILSFPNEQQVPKELLSHFLRGYIDGDGSINYKIHPKTQLKYFNVSILGTKNFLMEVQKLFNFTNLKLEDKKSFFILHISGNKKVFEFLSNIYKESNPLIQLDRKREKYELLKYQREHIVTYSTNKNKEN